MTSTTKSSICMLLKYSTCIKTIALKIMNCTRQCFMMFSIWSRSIKICSHRLSEISSTRFVTHKNIESLIQIVRESELNWCIESSKNHFFWTDHWNKSFMWKEIIVSCLRLFEIERTNWKKTHLNENDLVQSHQSHQSSSHRSNFLLRQFSHLYRYQLLHLSRHRSLHRLTVE
jgi:hypothetical protein